MNRMDDLISRQAALDAMETWDKFGCDPDGKLVRCDNDKHYIPYVHYEDMVHAIKHLPSAQPEQRWIPCSERLPEHRLYVLVTYKYEYGLIDNGITWYSETENKWNTSREVIAWMPLPESYRGANE